MDVEATWQLSSVPPDRLLHRWSNGRFESARRSFTACVEGKIRSDSHLLMATLRGGARHHRITTDAGASFEGADHAGTVSFLPAGCTRNLLLRDVAWEWGAIALDPRAVNAELAQLPPFVVSQMHALLCRDGALDEIYCEAMALAVVEYLLRRHDLAPPEPRGQYRLTAWQLRQTMERIDSLLAGRIRIEDLSRPLNLSEGHFYRAFRGSAGRSPVQMITQRRIERAAALLIQSDLPVNVVALEVGYGDPSRLARAFRDVQGLTPSQYRQQYRERI
jgi:AraC family transcriptional regulator